MTKLTSRLSRHRPEMHLSNSAKNSCHGARGIPGQLCQRHRSARHSGWYERLAWAVSLSGGITRISAGSAVVDDGRRASEVCGYYGQLRRVGRRSGSEAASDSTSCTSPVKIGSERRTATTTRWASTTSLVPERASRFPTSGPSSKATTTTDCRNRARRACRAPLRHTWAMTGCVVVRGVSWTSAAVRNSCAARSPRSTEIRNPASRIKNQESRP